MKVKEIIKIIEADGWFMVIVTEIYRDRCLSVEQIAYLEEFSSNYSKKAIP